MKVLTGKMSTFGGPRDTGVSPSEGLALIEPRDLKARLASLFLPGQPEGTTGLARRLNPKALYCAMRWNYAQTPKKFLQQAAIKVSAGGKTIFVRAVDWGPARYTGRLIDLSPGATAQLGLKTDDTVTVEVPEP
jgi:hypothetical protein